MVFYIHDQGARAITPLDQLLKPTNILATDKTARLRSVKYKTQPGEQSDLAATASYTQSPSSDISERPKLIYARDIMSGPVRTCRADHSIKQQWTVLGDSEFHHLPVINRAGHLCGIVSDRDFLRFIAKQGSYPDHATHQIGSIMTSRVISAAEHSEVRTIAEVLCRRSIGAVPIVDEGNTIVGIVTRTDILRALVNQAPLELWA